MGHLPTATGGELTDWLGTFVLDAVLTIMLFIVVFALCVAIRFSKRSFNLLVWAAFGALLALGFVVAWVATPWLDARYVAAALVPISIVLAAVGTLRYLSYWHKASKASSGT